MIVSHKPPVLILDPDRNDVAWLQIYQVNPCQEPFAWSDHIT